MLKRQLGLGTADEFHRMPELRLSMPPNGVADLK